VLIFRCLLSELISLFVVYLLACFSPSLHVALVDEDLLACDVGYVLTRYDVFDRKDCHVDLEVGRAVAVVDDVDRAVCHNDRVGVGHPLALVEKKLVLPGVAAVDRQVRSQVNTAGRVVENHKHASVRKNVDRKA